MKKSVVFAIAIIYLMAIIVVGFLGQALKVYNENIYVEQIECISEDYKPYKKTSKEFKEGYSGFILVDEYEEGLKVLIKCRVLPANATYKELDYFSTDTSICTIEKQTDGTAIAHFKKAGAATVVIKATDNGAVSIKINILAYDNSDFA
mgnify:CR=1 FL=1